MTTRAQPIRIVAALIADTEGRVLLVRKRGSGVFIQPGGKSEPGEATLATLARELREELGIEVVPHLVQPLGQFEADAVHEAGRRVSAQAFVVAIDGEPAAQAEIEELRWIAPRPPFPVTLAPLSAQHILPAWRALRARMPRDQIASLSLVSRRTPVATTS